jgi:argininosuccinate lyase
VKGGGAEVRLWGGRFHSGPAAELDRLNRSLPVDWRLWRQDLAVSQAWVEGLREAGVLGAEDAGVLASGLDEVGARLEQWTQEGWAAAGDEDIHTLVERLLAEEVGEVAGKLRTGRSRNDQVATDGRLWAMTAVGALEREIRGLQAALVDRAERYVGLVMPSYTHLQRAQPVLAGHWLLSHFWPLERDVERLGDARRRTAVLPLGSGAVAGCPFPVDRARLAGRLGFEGVSENSMDAVADRDWVAELLFVIALLGVHLSRLGEDLIVFASSEFGFVRLSDSFSTGSSLMPQKRNPDPLELARAKAGRLVGELAGFMGVLKGLPSGYNKDLQEDKTALFGAVDTLLVLIPAVTGAVGTLELDEARCEAAVDAGMMATDVADALVRSGMPFRKAHDEVGRVVRAAEAHGCSPAELPGVVLREASAAVAALPLAELLEARASVARRAGEGGTAPDAVAAQLRRAKARLDLRPPQQREEAHSR